MKPTQVSAAAVVAVLTLTPMAADAYCACACVNGKAQNVCSNAFDPEVYCVKYCPTNVLPLGAPQRNPDLEGFAAEAGKSNPQDKVFIGSDR